MNTTSNAVRKDEYQVVSFPQPATKPALICVDLAEQNRVLFNLLKEEENAKHSGGKVFATLKGKLVQKTYYDFLSAGFSGILPGLNKCLNMKNHAERLEALQTLEAVYYLFKYRKVSRFEQVTAEMMAVQRASIQASREQFSASQDWIVSYKAQQAAAFEGKDVKMQRKLDFCEQVFGAAK